MATGEIKRTKFKTIRLIRPMNAAERAQRAANRAWQEAFFKVSVRVHVEYQGKWIAWAPDRLSVAGSGASVREAREDAVRRGFNPDEISFQLMEQSDFVIDPVTNEPILRGQA